MPLFAVTYTYATDSGTARDGARSAHVDFLRALRTAGHLVASGPLEEPDGALLLVRGEQAAQVAVRMDDDPFLRSGVVAERTVRPWAPYFGGAVEGRE